MPNKFTNTTVCELTASGFDNKFNVKAPQNGGLMLFYFDWCGYCEDMKPEYIKLSKNKTFKICAINGAVKKNKPIFAKYKIPGAPFIKYFNKNGKLMAGDYKGNRTATDMLKFIKSKSSNLSQTGGAKKKPRKKTKATKKRTRKTTTKKSTGLLDMLTGLF